MAYIEDNKFSLLFCDKNSNVTDALHWYLPKREWIQVFNGDIFSFSFDAIVSPANSFGFMDGGFDKVILERLGSYIEKATKSIAPVPVGEARTIRLFQKDRPFFLIMAPTM